MSNSSQQSPPSLKAYQFSLRRIFLWVHIVAVSCSAAIGIGQILTGRDDDFRVLLTAVTIAFASVCGLSCGAALEGGRGKIVPLAGLALTLVSTLMLIALIWFEPRFWRNESWLKWTFVNSTFAVACSHVSLLSMARLAPRFSWAFRVAFVAIFGVATLVSSLAFFDGPAYATDLFRWIAVVAIIDAMMSVLIPVFHFISRGELQPQTALTTKSRAQIDAEISRLEEQLAELRRVRELTPDDN